MRAERWRTLIDRALYLLKSWTEDRERCQAANIGDEVEFATKVQLALAMVRRAVEERIPFRWVTADAGYGYSKGWRYEMELPVSDLAAVLPRQKWKRRSCGQGAHGSRMYD